MVRERAQERRKCIGLLVCRVLRKLTLLKGYNDLAVGSGGEGWKPDN